jgi:hypothetical protein
VSVPSAKFSFSRKTTWATAVLPLMPEPDAKAAFVSTF